MTVTNIQLICHKCGKNNPIEAKRCRNRSCQAWFKTPEHTSEWKQKSSESNKKYWNEFYTTEDGQKMKEQISKTLSTPESKERSRKLFIKHAQHLGNTPEAKMKKSETMKRIRKENPDKYWGGIPRGGQMTEEHKEALQRSYHQLKKNGTSKKEKSLIPYLEPLGFTHAKDKFFPVKNGERCKYPDFFNEETKQIVEVFGTYWHRDMILPDGKQHQTPEEVINWYAEVGWSCVIVWENEISDFIESLKGIN